MLGHDSRADHRREQFPQTRSPTPFRDRNPKRPKTGLPNQIDGGEGPFAGDVAVYSVNLFSDPTVKRRAGSGVYTCYFNYDQHALCQAYYKLAAGSTLVASGPISFKSSGFTIVLTGGTNTYLGVRGQVVVAAARKKNTQRVDFEVVK